MNDTSDPELIAERLESIKAGILGGFAVCLGFAITNLFNSLLLARFLGLLYPLRINAITWQLLVSAIVATCCGLLFGVTFRYIVRTDNNPQLKAGAVLAFGLVRGLTQVDVALSCRSPVLPFMVLGVESIFWFVIAAIALDWAMAIGWIKPFTSDT